MSFSPGQIITAQRLNRLQPKVYWAMASGSTAVSGNVAGTAMSITTETAGATAAISWTCTCYATGAMGGNTNTQAKYDLATSPTFALAQFSANGEKGTPANFWSTTVAAAGTYTFQLTAAINASSLLQIYTSIMVMILEVA